MHIQNVYVNTVGWLTKVRTGPTEVCKTILKSISRDNSC